MKCQACGEREATIHEVVISGSKRVERHLCEVCAHKAGLGPQPALTQALSQFLVAQGKSKEAGALAAGVCASCGTTWASFRESGLLGCPDCYSTFESILGPMIERAHEGGTHHVGKIPHRKFTGGPVRRGVESDAESAPPAGKDEPHPRVALGPEAPGAEPGAPGETEGEIGAGAAAEAGAPKGARIPGSESLGLDAETIAQRETALRRQLAEAVEAEQYERAAKIRDQLKRLADIAARMRTTASQRETLAPPPPSGRGGTSPAPPPPPPGPINPAGDEGGDA